MSSAACSCESHAALTRDQNGHSRILSHARARVRAFAVSVSAAGQRVNKTCLLARELEECNDLRHCVCDVAFGSADGARRRRLLITRTVAWLRQCAPNKNTRLFRCYEDAHVFFKVLSCVARKYLKYWKYFIYVDNADKKMVTDKTVSKNFKQKND